jgi:hypothetical protein
LKKIKEACLSTYFPSFLII